MPARYYRRYRRRYPYRTYSRRYGYYSRSQRRTSRNQTAARQQRDKAEINISVPSRFEVFNGLITLNNGENVAPTTFETGVFALNIWDLLRKSEFYQSYSNMYDQVKIEKVTVKLTPYHYPIYTNTVGIGQYYNGYTVVTAWDRTGLSEEQIYVRNTATSGRATLIGSNDNSDGLYVTIDGPTAGTYRSVNPNSNTTITRSIYPSTIAEKGYYVNTADLDSWYGSFDPLTDRYYGIPNPRAVNGNGATVSDGSDIVTVPQYPLELIESKAITKNPAFIVETPEVPFKPTLLVGIYNDPISINNEQLIPRMSFNVEADIVCSFRGLRKASIV
ncbi:hypothetical protein BCR32DRAFT_248747 [Anaeromyces robustus]|uniref:BZIP domain-containing protein n=1 Tax=Anaeromyces robustus TaxID=1754192 RepID=A0A1Y1WSZ7_9FUNG|nr:hypothetical protein BCR32DRAFT_248747 [Anaeromyces robustus]|eukprot:ORX76418.1 hypothetical protein BCR32DRAFT_248747 [Anaeromyces robustus]